MVAISLFLAVVFTALGAAWPEPTPAAQLDQRAVDCSKVTGALSVLKKLGPPATSFCSSYLKIAGTKTVTTTFTPATVTSTTSTTTVTVTRSVCNAAKRMAVGRHQDLAMPAHDDANVDKRTDVLAILAAFAAAKVSEGCSCLNLQPKATTTDTRTAVAPTTNVVATSMQCVTPPVCKPAGLNFACTMGSDCCSGNCQTVVGSPSCCDLSGQSCDINNPGTCCSATCAFYSQSGVMICL